MENHMVCCRGVFDATLFLLVLVISPPNFIKDTQAARHHLPAQLPMLEHLNLPPSAGQGCPAGCNRRGLCTHGRCVCVVAWSGDDCSVPVTLPCKQQAVNFTGWAFNMATAEHDMGLYQRQFSILTGGADAAGKADAVVGMLREQLMVPPTDPLMRILGKTCAVVGSSEILLSCDVGQQIDAHDVVIRLNDAPTVGYERNVGSRTTLRFQGTMRAIFREGNEFTINLSHTFLYNGGGRNLIAYPEIAGKSGYYSVHRGYSNLQMSFGWKSIHAALHLCGQVTLFGFSAVEQGKPLPTNGFSHYYAKWFDSKAFSLYALEAVGMARKGAHSKPSRACVRRLAPGQTRPAFCLNEVGSLLPTESVPEVAHRWWTHGKRNELTWFLNDARNIEGFRVAVPDAHKGRMATGSLHEIKAKASRYGLPVNCSLPWTNHCIDEEAACTAQLPSMVPHVRLVCCGVGSGSGL
eukprot:jgi/Mesvir1/14998/Mv14657-RA.1